VPVGVDRPAAFPAEQAVQRQARNLPEDIPQGHVDPAQGIVQHRPVSPVGTDERRLPGVLDLQRVASHQERLQEVFDGGLDGAGPLRKRGAAQPVQSRLIGQDLDHDQPDAGGCREDRADFGDLEI
jgi:hypothetical protein